MSLLQLEQRKLILFDLDGTLVDTASDMYHSCLLYTSDAADEQCMV